LIGLIAGSLAFVTLVVVGVVVVVGIIDRGHALDERRQATLVLTDAVAESRRAVDQADDVIAVAADPLVSADLVAAVTAERDAAAAALAGAATLVATDSESLDTEAIRALTARIDAAAADMSDDDEQILAAVRDLLAATATEAPAVESANFDAENDPHLAFRAATADLSDPPDDALAESLAKYLAAAHALEASHAEEIAEKAGPLLDRRLTVEAFARSIAGGVLLDFDWAPTVNGYGLGGSYGGTSYWQSAEGGYATITLSDSVATMWPGAGVQSLVAHEVGHAILSKCTSLFFGSGYDEGGEEPWATAWAIGMGYTADGNGESIYGRPPDGLIELSTQCR
jgi:hypothetical protein